MFLTIKGIRLVEIRLELFHKNVSTVCTKVARINEPKLAYLILMLNSVKLLFNTSSINSSFLTVLLLGFLNGS